jgi:hypothetical protein
MTEPNPEAIRRARSDDVRGRVFERDQLVSYHAAIEIRPAGLGQPAFDGLGAHHAARIEIIRAERKLPHHHPPRREGHRADATSQSRAARK